MSFPADHLQFVVNRVQVTGRSIIFQLVVVTVEICAIVEIEGVDFTSVIEVNRGGQSVTCAIVSSRSRRVIQRLVRLIMYKAVKVDVVLNRNTIILGNDLCIPFIKLVLVGRVDSPTVEVLGRVEATFVSSAAKPCRERLANAPVALETTEGYITKLALDENGEVIGYQFISIGRLLDDLRDGAFNNIEDYIGVYGRYNEGVVFKNVREEKNNVV